MIVRLQKPLLGKLALDFRQAFAQAAQKADGNRLVVDEGPAASVGRKAAPQDDLTILCRNLLLCQKGDRRMAGGDFEACRHRGLLQGRQVGDRCDLQLFPKGAQLSVRAFPGEL